MQTSGEFNTQIEKLKKAIGGLSSALAKGSVPFWNPRYNGHMLMDTTMPSIAGYLAAMLFNPNNNAVEASPLTTMIEQQVGLELSYMIGFNTNPKIQPTAWGHITCGGTVANLEAVWAARNLKFYPLSLRLAMEAGGPLEYIADSFEIETCTGTKKLLRDLDSWELLNITPEVALEIEDCLHTQYQIALPYLRRCLEPYSVQNLSKGADGFQRLGQQYIKDMVLMTSATRHYSWPKAAAVTGIGAENCLPITVDNAARMDMDDLRKHLDECLLAKRPIYTVVGIMGSTEHGACDPIDKMVEIRNEYRKKGLSFLLHADGAWGTYFASMIPRGTRGAPIVPSLALKPSTLSAMLALPSVDTVTVDPHKSGYVQYPAGGLLYRDGRLRHQISITSPIVFRDDAESMGVFGIEGSKPGAAAVATWVSHQVIGLNPQGYGEILGEALFSCVKLYAHLATMSTDNTDFIVRPLNMLPAEIAGGNVEAQKEFIRNRILNVPNEKLVKDEEAMKLIHEMGSDYAINAFAVNFKINGKVNEDVVEANALNKRIFERLSVNDAEKDVNTVPLYLTSTQLGQKPYGKCLTNFKNRLGLKGDEDLYTLVNVTASPFPTTNNFTGQNAKDLMDVIMQEVKTSQQWNTSSPDLHGFIMQGTDRLYLVHLPMFNMENHRAQLILTGDVPANVMNKYRELKRRKPAPVLALGNANRERLEELVKQGWMDAYFKDMSNPKVKVMEGFKLTNIQVVVNRSLRKASLTTYPRLSIPFYIYGTKDQLHVDHCLLARPNIMLNSEQVKLDGPSLPALKLPAIVHFHNLSQYPKSTLSESAMQPFAPNSGIRDDVSFFFKPGNQFDVSICSDIEAKDVLWKGKLTLRSEGQFVDVNELNDPDVRDPEVKPEPHDHGPHDEHAEPTPAPSKPAPGGHGIFGGIKDLPIIGDLPVIGSRPPFEGLLPDLPRIGTFERKSFLSFKVNPLGIPLVDVGADPRRGAGYLNILDSIKLSIGNVDEGETVEE